MSLANPSRLRWRDALSTKVREEVSAAVLSNYTLAVLLCELAWHGEYAGKPLELPAKPVDRTMFLAARRTLVQRAILLAQPCLQHGPGQLKPAFQQHRPVGLQLLLKAAQAVDLGKHLLGVPRAV